MLKFPDDEFKETQRLSKKIDDTWSSVVLPESLKYNFCSAWKNHSQHNAESANGQLRLFTSPDKFEIIPDANLAKAICSYPLHKLLHEIKNAARKLADNNNINSFREDFKAASKSTPPSWSQWENALKKSNLSEAEQNIISTFLTDAERFYGIKGIARDDFATPAITQAMGVRTDRLSIADQIAAATSAQIYIDCVNFIDGLSSEKEAVSVEAAFANICLFCADFEKRNTPIKTNDPECVKVLESLSEITSFISEEFSNYRGVPFEIKHSKGSGNFPRVPWICILPPGQSPSSGVYFSMCFGREGNGAVAGLAESVQNRGRLKIKERIEESKVINVNGGDPKQYYNNTYENPLEILKDSFSYEELKEHVRVSLDRALDCLDLKQSNPPMPFSKIPSELSEYTVCEALLSKPFTILTGASGTGKTKLATSLAKYLSNIDGNNSQIVAVGADWTDTRSVLGFVNHLNADDEGPRYQSTPILDLLLRATKDPEVPYFLILDEMNLSHVERYFADFLSAMEQKNGSLKLHSESSELRRAGSDDAEVPAEIEYPENLFVIGTVNIDETTYMFSPKVLDRANVIEFTVSEDEIGAFLKEPHDYPEIERAELGIAEGFLQLAMQARTMGCDKLPEQAAEDISKHLLDLFNILKAERFEFAYRTAKEINIYLQVCRHLAEDKTSWDTRGWRKDLDHQILQKLLPKLHGSAGRIGKLLATLAHYCDSGEYKTDISTQLSAAAELKSGEKTAFPKSLAKLQSMIGTLRDEQFVSFIQ